MIKNPVNNEVTQTIYFDSLPAQQRALVCSEGSLSADDLGNIYLGTFRGFFIYSNETKAWRLEERVYTSPLGGDNQSVIAIGKSTVYIRTGEGFIFKSTDAGQTWMQLKIDPKNQYRASTMIINPANTVYIMAYEDYTHNPVGIFKLNSGETQWIAENNGLSIGKNDLYGVGLATDGMSTMYVHVWNKVYKLMLPWTPPE